MLADLLALSPVEFERTVARLLPYLGCDDPQLTGRAGDLGADIVCTDEHGGRVIVQCKRFAPGKTVTSPDIQQFFGMMVHHVARRGIYVTTSGYTRSARDLAEARDIRTIDGNELAELFAAHPEALGFLPPQPFDSTPKSEPPGFPVLVSAAEPLASPASIADKRVPETAIAPVAIVKSSPPELTVSPATQRKSHWRCLGCNRPVAASTRQCPNCFYEVAPLQWERMTRLR